MKTEPSLHRPNPTHPTTKTGKGYCILQGEGHVRFPEQGCLNHHDPCAVRNVKVHLHQGLQWTHPQSKLVCL